jgi:hypothetical protein
MHLPFIFKMVHERYKKKVHEDGAMPDLIVRAASKDTVIWLVLGQHGLRERHWPAESPIGFWQLMKPFLD